MGRRKYRSYRQVRNVHNHVVLQLRSPVRLFTTPRTAASQASLSFSISQSLFLSIESMMPSDHRILSSPFSLALNRSHIRFFSNESALHTRWQKYWSFSISPSNEYSGLISFSTDWFDLLAIQGTLKSLLQHHSLKASILWRLAFFMVQIYI